MRLAIAVLLLGLALAPVTLAQTETVLAANYDAILVVNGSTSHVSSRARVRNGSTIPIELSTHRIDITLTDDDGDNYEAKIRVFEKSNREWYQVNAETISFLGQFGVPVEYAWAVTDMQLDLKMIVSVLAY